VAAERAINLAIAEQDESFVIDTPYGPRRFTRSAGEILHSARESRQTLETIRRTIGEYMDARSGPGIRQSAI